MKVVLINSVCGKGSTGRIVNDIYNNLIANGHQALVAYGRGSAPEGINSYRISSDVGVKMHGLLSRITDRHAFYSSHSTRKFIKVLDEYKPQLIHIHNLHGYYLNIKILFDYIKEKQIPVVLTLHDCWCFTGHCAYFDKCNCEKWIKECSNCQLKKEYPSSFLCDASSRNYIEKKKIFDYDKLTVITPSAWLADLAARSFLGKHDIFVVYNGINTENFKPAVSDFKEKYGLTDKKIVLGVADVWSERKGLRDFMTLCEKLGDEFRIVLVGLKKDQIQALPEKIIGIERTSSVSALAEIYSAADVYLNLTYGDNFPTTNIESLCCATPVITYKTGGSPEAIAYGGGFCVEQGDVDKVAEIVKNTDFSKFENECIDASHRFSREHMSAQLLEIYKELLSK